MQRLVTDYDRRGFGALEASLVGALSSSQTGRLTSWLVQQGASPAVPDSCRIAAAEKASGPLGIMLGSLIAQLADRKAVPTAPVEAVLVVLRQIFGDATGALFRRDPGATAERWRAMLQACLRDIAAADARTEGSARCRVERALTQAAPALAAHFEAQPDSLLAKVYGVCAPLPAS